MKHYGGDAQNDSDETIEHVTPNIGSGGIESLPEYIGPSGGGFADCHRPIHHHAIIERRVIDMDFGLTAEQKLLQETLRDFAMSELLPGYAARDKDEDLQPPLVRKLGELGVLAPMVDAKHGGSGLDYVALGIAHEEIARGDFNAAYVLLLSALGRPRSSARSADDRQQAAFLPPFARRFSGRARRDRAFWRFRCGPREDAGASRRRYVFAHR